MYKKKLHPLWLNQGVSETHFFCKVFLRMPKLTNACSRCVFSNPQAAFVREKAPNDPDSLSRSVSKQMRHFRAGLSDEDRLIRSAVEVSGEVFRCAVRGTSLKTKGHGLRNRVAKQCSLRPRNFEELLALIPVCFRQRPIAVGEEIVYVPHSEKDLTCWIRAQIVAILPHREHNVVRR